MFGNFQRIDKLAQFPTEALSGEKSLMKSRKMEFRYVSTRVQKVSQIFTMHVNAEGIE
jgi:hypothetical protein